MQKSCSPSYKHKCKRDHSHHNYSICMYIRMYSICDCDITGWYGCMHACEHTVVQWYDDESNWFMYIHMHYIAIYFTYYYRIMLSNIHYKLVFIINHNSVCH